MNLDQSLLKKNRFLTTGTQNKFYAYKAYPYIEEIDRSMRRFETGFRCTEKHWIFSDENHFYQR